MIAHYSYKALLVLNWLVALNWAWRVFDALRNLPRVPDLLNTQYDVGSEPALELPPHAMPASAMKICVIVPACNEEASIAETLESLLATEGVAIEIIAVNDRSTDPTGEIMEAVASSPAAKRLPSPILRVLHITELPRGWLGKPHAMAVAARQTTAEWLLFTDGDVVYRADTLRRAMRFVELERLDHLVINPTLVLKLFGERVMMSCINVLSIWILRPWKIPDPRARKDSVGVGAFNMVRREVYTAVGGYEALRMEVLDDLRLGYKIKRAGYRQGVAFGRGLISVRWAVGARGVMANLTKNAFALFRFSVPLLVASCCGLAMLSLMPFVFPLVARLFTIHPSWWQWAPAGIMFFVFWMTARYYERHVGIPPAFVLTFPVGVCLFLYAILRSMLVTLRDGGVRWRGTLYPLAELRRHVGPVR